MENKKDKIQSIIIIVLAWLMALAILWLLFVKIKFIFQLFMVYCFLV